MTRRRPRFRVVHWEGGGLSKGKERDDETFLGEDTVKANVIS